MTNKEVMQIAMQQSAEDIGCTVEDLLAGELFNVGSGLHAKFLDGGATFANDDGLL